MSDAVRHWYGFGLSLLTAVLWGVLPVFLKICLDAMDSQTITWYRFVFAAVFVFIVLLKSRALPPLGRMTKHTWYWLSIATLALVVNYVGNVMGLEFIAPETAQVLMQLAPLLLMLGGILFYKEHFTRLQTFGASFLVIGLLLFFNRNLMTLFAGLGDYTLGVIIIVIAAVAWSVYALMQKVLLRSLTAKQLTLLIYVFGALVLTPFVSLSQLAAMSSLQLWALLFYCLNTLIAYGAFTEALHVWQASKVSAVLALSPVFTFISMAIGVQVFPQYLSSTDLNTLAYVGAAVVVVGSIVTALGRAPTPARVQTSHE